MTVLYLEARAAIAASRSVLMAGAWVAQQRTHRQFRLGGYDLDVFPGPRLRCRAVATVAPSRLIPIRCIALAQSGGRLSLATRAERICAEIMPKMKEVPT
jgi:hypothetical protein